MSDIRAAIQAKMPLTISEMIAMAKEHDTRVVDVVLLETELRTGLSREEILTGIMNEYAHNLKAVEIGVKDGESILLGTVASQLAAQEGPKCFEDSFLDDALLYTLGAQVGNHCIGLRPCAGTGDSCPYSGFIKAMMVHGYDDKTVAETAAAGGFDEDEISLITGENEGYVVKFKAMELWDQFQDWLKQL